MNVAIRLSLAPDGCLSSYMPDTMKVEAWHTAGHPAAEPSTLKK